MSKGVNRNRLRVLGSFEYMYPKCNNRHVTTVTFCFQLLNVSKCYTKINSLDPKYIQMTIGMNGNTNLVPYVTLSKRTQSVTTVT